MSWSPLIEETVNRPLSGPVVLLLFARVNAAPGVKPYAAQLAFFQVIELVPLLMLPKETVRLTVGVLSSPPTGVSWLPAWYWTAVPSPGLEGSVTVLVWVSTSWEGLNVGAVEGGGTLRPRS